MNRLEGHENEKRLAELAYKWRQEHSIGEFKAADEAATEYLKVMKRLWSMGWRGEGLLPDEELPDDLLPRYYLDHWRQT